MEPMYPCWTLDLRKAEHPFMEPGIWCRHGSGSQMPCACRALPLQLWGSYLGRILEQQRRYGEYFLEHAERMGFLYASLVRTACDYLLGVPHGGKTATIRPDVAIVTILYDGTLVVPIEAQGRVRLLRDVEGLWEPCRMALCVMPASARSKRSDSVVISLDGGSSVQEIMVTYRGGGQNFNPYLFRLSAKDGQPPGYRPFRIQPVVARGASTSSEDEGDTAVA